jgi:hypothetical protein
MAFAQGAEAQKWKEWFNQKKTQKEYLVKQVAALKIYLEYVKKGYDIAQKGLSIVGDIKGQNFNDHADHFTSLKIVKDDLGNGSKLNLIITRQVAIMNDFRELNSECRGNKNLTPDEIRYVSSVYSNLLSECERSIASLNAVVTDEASQMTDDERIDRIDEIYDDINDKYAFTRSFCNSTRILLMQRGAENNEIESAKKLNGIL